jgi:hypothetical protein
MYHKNSSDNSAEISIQLHQCNKYRGKIKLKVEGLAETLLFLMDVAEINKLVK